MSDNQQISKKNSLENGERKSSGQTAHRGSSRRRPYKLRWFLLISLAVLLTLIDQLVKRYAVNVLREGGPKEILPGVFELRYLENRGAAFGMLSSHPWIFILFAFFIIGLSLFLEARLIPLRKHFRPLRVALAVLSAGAAGNMLDRLFRGYVVDLFYFRLINFPIFNMADVYVTVSAVFIVLFLIFRCSENDFLEMSGKKSSRQVAEEIVEKVNESREDKRG